MNNRGQGGGSGSGSVGNSAGGNSAGGGSGGGGITIVLIPCNLPNCGHPDHIDLVDLDKRIARRLKGKQIPQAIALKRK